MKARPICAIGVDFGTSGCRAVAIDVRRLSIASAALRLPAPTRAQPGSSEQDPMVWWRALTRVLRRLSAQLTAHDPVALAIDGTSGTLLLADRDGNPQGPALMYDDSRSREAARRIAVLAPPDSPARGAGSSLAKLLYLGSLAGQGQYLALHQADWLAGRLTSRYGHSDWHNCLKLGYDPGDETWPEWIDQLSLGHVRLPVVSPPGRLLGPLSARSAELTGLSPRTRVFSGTTDSTASVLATGISEPGNAVTVLGSTLVVKILGHQRLLAPELGVYSHRLGDLWLAGGASNSGGAVLRRFFSDSEIQSLSARLRPAQPTGLDYYPLATPGERFPVNDPELAPRLQPRPPEDWRFFQGLLEGIARIEVAGYALLQRLGAPAPRSVQSIGGGAANAGWRQIREALLGIPVTVAQHQEAAFGTATLALRGWHSLASGEQ
jgi:sugar (pentulose or hexulose) kinase